MIENKPLELETIRACPYCSHSSNTGIDELIHLSNHSDDEKRFLQSGDIHRLIQLCEKQIWEFERYRENNPCCDSDICLHNYKTAREKRYEIIIEKLKQYEDPNDVRTIIYPNFSIPGGRQDE